MPMRLLRQSSAEIVGAHAGDLDIVFLQPDVPSRVPADSLVARSGLRAGCQKIGTFDRKAARLTPGMELLA
ncbi:hypothetical protein ASG03_19350 [Rhizobium sp. Leaf341]|nr:hypothetical protein ASG03_19350 [Rhizobium sp. Leaf341]